MSSSSAKRLSQEHGSGERQDIHFVKMQATGNDFIVVDARSLKRDWSELARKMCHRHFGVGADGLILLLPSEVAALRMRMINPDGSEAEACGNGLRCLARYAVESGFHDSPEFEIETLSGVRTARVEGEKIRVGMGRPRLVSDDIPAALGASNTIYETDYPLAVAGRELKVDIVSMGNPHTVSFLVESVADFPLSQVGPEVENHSMFPNRTNFEVANVLSRNQIQARVWERGAGETLSCGSGACAIAVAARLHGFIDDRVDIELPGGTLTVDWDGAREVYLSGPAEVVFEGEWKRA